MIKTLSLVLLPCLLAGAGATGLRAQDDDVKGRRWFIDVDYRKLRPITVKDPVGRGRTRTYWYVVLKLTNKTGEDRPLDLTARALTPQDKKSPVARPGLYAAVTEEIGKKEKIDDLVNLMALSGELEDGQSKSVVIVFPDLSDLANHIDLRVSGLTNTLYREGRTVWREDTELSIKFHRVGDEYDVTRNPVHDRGKSWVTLKREKIRG